MSRPSLDATDGHYRRSPGPLWLTTTRPDDGAVRLPDLVDRNFTATRPSQLWVSDFTHVATWSGFVYTAFVIDVSARRIAG